MPYMTKDMKAQSYVLTNINILNPNYGTSTYHTIPEETMMNPLGKTIQVKQREIIGQKTLLAPVVV